MIEASLLLSGAAAWLLLIRQAWRLQRKQRLWHDLIHDIRAPLSRLLLRVELLRRQLPDEPELVDGLEADLQTLLELNNDLGCIEQPAAEQPQATAVPLAACCRHIATGYPAAAVQVEIDPALTLRVDRRRLQRALHNLIDNALEHGAPPVLIRAEVRAEGPLILVDDHGRSGGKPPPQTHQGLGWVIVRRFCQSHGGDLAIGPSPLGGLQLRLQLGKACLAAPA